MLPGFNFETKTSPSQGRKHLNHRGHHQIWNF